MPVLQSVIKCIMITSLFIIFICRSGSALDVVSSKALGSPMTLKSELSFGSLISHTVKQSPLRLKGGSSVSQVFIARGTRRIAPALVTQIKNI
jgi:hypothetical protein